MAYSVFKFKFFPLLLLYFSISTFIDMRFTLDFDGSTYCFEVCYYLSSVIDLSMAIR